MEPTGFIRALDTPLMSITSFNPNRAQFKGKKIILKSNPIFRNNYFLKCYNTSYNQVNGVVLSKLPRNNLYYSLFPGLSIKYLLVHLALAFIPYVNIIWAGILIVLWLIYERAALVYKKNRKKLRDPFLNMIYSPELCKKYKSMNKFLEVPVEFLSFSQIAMQTPREKMTIMIYNDSFKKMHTHFPYYRFYHLAHIFLCLVILLNSYIWIYKKLLISNQIPIFGST